MVQKYKQQNKTENSRTYFDPKCVNSSCSQETPDSPTVVLHPLFSHSSLPVFPKLIGILMQVV